MSMVIPVSGYGSTVGLRDHTVVPKEGGLLCDEAPNLSSNGKRDDDAGDDDGWHRLTGAGTDYRSA